jgi:tetratricopeptide (TPR) repeat protein
MTKPSKLAASSSIALLTALTLLSPALTQTPSAQEPEQPTQILPPQPVPPLSEQQENSVRELIREELRTSNEISDRVQGTVNQTFGWTITLINFLTAVLIAFPIGVGVIFWMLQQSITAKLENQIKSEIEREIKKKLQAQVTAELQERIEKFKQELAQQKVQLQLEFVAVQREKDRVIGAISHIIAERDRMLEGLPKEGVVPPEIQAKIRDLTHQLESLKQANPNLYLTAEDYLNQGDAFYYEQRYNEAIDSYDQALALQPDLVRAWVQKAKALRRSDQLEAALETNDRALQIDPTFQSAWFGRMYTLLNLKQYEEALVAVDRMIELNPLDEAWKWRGYILTKLGRYDEALDSLNKAIELHPHVGGVYYCKAYFHLTQEQLDQVFAHLKQAIELHPKLKEILKNDRDFDSIRTDEYFKSLFEVPMVNV